MRMRLQPAEGLAGERGGELARPLIGDQVPVEVEPLQIGQRAAA